MEGALMDDRSYRALLDRQPWDDIHARLLDFAEARTGKRAKDRAKDLAQTAILRVYSSESKWDPEKEPELLRYLLNVVNSLRANENTSAAAQRNVSTSNRKAKRAAEQVADPAAFSETSAIESDLSARHFTLLRERMADDPNVLQFLDCVAAGKESAADICEATDWSKEKHNAVRRRMLRAAALVARDLGGADDEDSLPSPEDDSEVDDRKVAP
jgi:DNA-directed RNA polymerase specialized sigma24 family protein